MSLETLSSTAYYANTDFCCAGAAAAAHRRQALSAAASPSADPVAGCDQGAHAEAEGQRQQAHVAADAHAAAAAGSEPAHATCALPTCSMISSLVKLLAAALYARSLRSPVIMQHDKTRHTCTTVMLLCQIRTM